MEPSHTVSLNDGHTLPAIGFGTWTLTGEEATRVVRSALDVGYRLIDTAPRYENEREVGAAIRSSGIARRDLFVATKLRGADHGYRSTLAGRGVASIPKTVSVERMRENIAIFDFALDEDDRVLLASLDRGVRWGGDPNIHEEL